MKSKEVKSPTKTKTPTAVVKNKEANEGVKKIEIRLDGRKRDVTGSATPIYLMIRNTSFGREEFNLFGFNMFNGVKNFGNKKCIEIYGLTHQSYRQFFNNTSSKELYVYRLKVQSNNAKNLKGVLLVKKHDLFLASDQTYPIQIPIHMDAYQQQGDIVEVDGIEQIVLDNNTHLSGTIEPESTMCITLIHKKTK